MVTDMDLTNNIKREVVHEDGTTQTVFIRFGCPEDGNQKYRVQVDSDKPIKVILILSALVDLLGMHIANALGPIGTLAMALLTKVAHDLQELGKYEYKMGEGCECDDCKKRREGKKKEEKQEAKPPGTPDPSTQGFSAN
jgi:hypothetical protein